jgi:hypothetical protein
VNKSRFRQISFPFGGLFRQNMAFERVFTLNFSCSGKGKPLFGTGISLHFWHFATPFVVYNST